jgi:hypothetical protein
MEKLAYKYRPHICFGLAFYALFVSRNSTVMIDSGLVLLVCGTYIALARSAYRSRYERGRSRSSKAA